MLKGLGGRGGSRSGRGRVTKGTEGTSSTRTEKRTGEPRVDSPLLDLSRGGSRTGTYEIQRPDGHVRVLGTSKWVPRGIKGS